MKIEIFIRNCLFIALKSKNLVRVELFMAMNPIPLQSVHLLTCRTLPFILILKVVELPSYRQSNIARVCIRITVRIKPSELFLGCVILPFP